MAEPFTHQAEQEHLAEVTQLAVAQVSIWFTNACGHDWVDFLAEAQANPPWLASNGRNMNLC